VFTGKTDGATSLTDVQITAYKLERVVSERSIHQLPTVFNYCAVLLHE